MWLIHLCVNLVESTWKKVVRLGTVRLGESERIELDGIRRVTLLHGLMLGGVIAYVRWPKSFDRDRLYGIVSPESVFAE
jgi:hypothetical protein